MRDYWAIRAKRYNGLKWVNSDNLLQALLEFSKISKSDEVLDAGCGTGVVANAVASIKVKKVVAIDKSEDMLKSGKFHKDVITRCCDIEEVTTFDKIIARMVFHHLKDVRKALRNLYNITNPGGWVIIQEGGVLPSKDKKVRKWYADMMALKEKRHNFTEEELKGHFKAVGFKNISTWLVIDDEFSINNWLKNSGQSKALQNKIYKLHLNAPQYVKDAYNMRMVDDEIFIDSRVLFIKGQK